MLKLSLIEAEAQQHIGRLAEARRRTLQEALIALCENHWQKEVRGPQPETPLAYALWSTTPPLADLFLDLYILGNGRLEDILPRRKPAFGLALLVLAEIERGNAEGVHIAYDPMMALESPPVPTHYIERITALLRGNLEVPVQHHHTKQPPLSKALAIITAHIRRCDSAAVLRVISLLADMRGVDHPPDKSLDQLRDDLSNMSVHFHGIEDDHIQLEIHGHEHKPVRKRQVEEMLFEIRQAWLG